MDVVLLLSIKQGDLFVYTKFGKFRYVKVTKPVYESSPLALLPFFWYSCVREQLVNFVFQVCFVCVAVFDSQLVLHLSLQVYSSVHLSCHNIVE